MTMPALLHGTCVSGSERAHRHTQLLQLAYGFSNYAGSLIVFISFYHKSCHERTSALYVPGVDADDHPCLKGVDTEAAEQFFSVAERRQIVLTL